MRALWALLAGCSAVLATVAMAKTELTPRHLIILRPGLEVLYGSYVFAAKNDGAAPERFEWSVMLPKEADDFAPQEGLEPESVSLVAKDAGAGRGVKIHKDIAPGVQVMGLGFRAPAIGGYGTLTLTPFAEVPSLTILIPRSTGLTVTADGFVAADPTAELNDPTYMAWTNQAPLAAGQAVAITVRGVPEGRGRLWALGGTVGGLLLLLGLWASFKTRPRLSERAGALGDA